MPICVVGMHRSGTSMVTYSLSQLGLDLGPRERIGVFEGSSENPKGFWEDLEMQGINDAILERHGGSWNAPPAFPAGWEDESSLDDLRERAIHLGNAVADRSRWLWKDPRSSLCLPFWRSLYPDLGLVFCIRSPLEVARSLAARTPAVPLADGLDLWYHYNRRILETAGELPCVLTLYDAYFPDPRREIESLSRWLGLYPVSRKTLRHLAEWITPDLKRQAADLDELARACDHRAELLLLYAWLRQAHSEQQQKLDAAVQRDGKRASFSPPHRDWEGLLRCLPHPGESTGGR